MGNNYFLQKIQLHTFNIVLIVTWVLYIIIALGISAKAPEYLDDLQYYVKLYVSLFLIWRFNPLRRIKVTHLDVKIGFSAGVFLLATTFIGQFMSTYLTQIQQLIK